MAVVPPALITFILQRYRIQALLSGSTKGQYVEPERFQAGQVHRLQAWFTGLGQGSSRCGASCSTSSFDLSSANRYSSPPLSHGHRKRLLGASRSSL